VTAAANADRTALRAFRGSDSVTWGEYARRVECIAGGLWALGVRPGSTVALMVGNRPEFNLVDTAALHLGGVPFSLDHPATAELTAYLTGNAEPLVLVTESELLPAVSEAVAAGDFPIEHLVVVADDAPPSEGWMTLHDVEALEPDGFDFASTWRAVGAEDLATIVYTSGTTGVPKGVQLPHRAIMQSMRGVHDMASVTPGDRVLAYLPAAHIAERFWSHYISMAFALELVSVPDPPLLDAALAEERPNRFFAVPRTYEKLAARANAMTWLGVATAPSSPSILAAHPRTQRLHGLRQGPRAHARDARRRRVGALGGSRPHRRRRLLPDRRAQEGHHDHLRRQEPRPGRDRERPRGRLAAHRVRGDHRRRAQVRHRPHRP
jgi:long-chain acyl-CoA synthetase